MTPLLAAIRARFEGDATLATYGKLWLTRVPREESGTALTPPYAMMLVVSSSVTDSFLQGMTETIIQLSLFHTNPETLATGFTALKSRFDNWARTSQVALSTGKLLGGKRESMEFSDEGLGTDQQNNPVYIAWARYRFTTDQAY